MANSTTPLNSGQISQSLAGRSCLENAQGRRISWVQRGPWLGSLQCPDPAGALWCQELPGLPPTTNELLKYTPSLSSLPLIAFFSVSRYGHFHACFLLLFCIWFSQFLPPVNFPLFYFASSWHFPQRLFLPDVSYSGILVCWPNICCMSLHLFFDLVAIASIFLLLLPFPSAWPYSLDCCS